MPHQQQVTRLKQELVVGCWEKPRSDDSNQVLTAWAEGADSSVKCESDELNNHGRKNRRVSIPGFTHRSRDEIMKTGVCGRGRSRGRRLTS